VLRHVAQQRQLTFVGHQRSLSTSVASSVNPWLDGFSWGVFLGYSICALIYVLARNKER
jgi:hypothetical protein